jgi:hypothetical protein
MNLNILKTPSGRLREAGARKILELRAQPSPPTYHEIANMLGVSIGTVFNVTKGRTWGWLSK